MEITFTLQLPRDAMSVPVVRQVLKTSMLTLGVNEDCVRDIEVALTEACTNVLDHALAEADYQVAASLDGEQCVIEVIDTGRGFDPDSLGHRDADEGAERGRGIQLIRALVDRVTFHQREQSGTIVHLEKDLVLREGAPMKVLTERAAP